MSNDDSYTPQIRSTLAALLFDPEGSDTRVYGEGWDNRLFLTNGGFLLRIARTPGDNERLLREVRALKAIEASRALPVPHVEWVHHPAANSPLAAMLYRPLPGASLDAADVDAEAGTALAPALAQFFDSLHAIPFGIIEGLGIPTFTPTDWLARHDELVDAMRETLRERLPSDVFDRFDRWWDEYQRDPAAIDFTPCFIHGDLACEHVLVQRDPWRVAGVIDFGDAMIADPALDLAGFPDALARAVMRLTSLADDEFGVWNRRDAYRRIAPLHAVRAGIERQDFALLDEGICGLEERFSR